VPFSWKPVCTEPTNGPAGTATRLERRRVEPERGRRRRGAGAAGQRDADHARRDVASHTVAWGVRTVICVVEAIVPCTTLLSRSVPSPKMAGPAVSLTKVTSTDEPTGPNPVPLIVTTVGTAAGTPNGETPPTLVIVGPVQVMALAAESAQESPGASRGTTR
jgi:hypothetical protein